MNNDNDPRYKSAEELEHEYYMRQQRERLEKLRRKKIEVVRLLKQSTHHVLTLKNCLLHEWFEGIINEEIIDTVFPVDEKRGVEEVLKGYI